MRRGSDAHLADQAEIPEAHIDPSMPGRADPTGEVFMPARNRRQEDIRPYELDFITHEPRKLHEHGAECDGCEGLDARGERGGGAHRTR